MSVLEIGHRDITFEPRPPAARTWTRRIMGGGQRAETCPSWCTDHHLGDEHGALDDLQHGTNTAGVEIPIADWQGGTVSMPLLSARVAVEPYSADPSRAVPHVLVEAWESEYTDPMGPGELAELIGRARAHLDRLEQVVLGQLATARSEAGVI